MRALLDTHIIIWALTEPQRLSTVARTLIENRSNVLLASAASAWEIGTKYRLGKLPLLEATVLNYQSQLDNLGAETLSVTVSHALLAGQLAWSHGDPFDRMLVAQAMLEGVPLVTNDAALTTIDGVELIW